MPMGQSTSLSIWQSDIKVFPSSTPDRLKYLSIMDDLLLHSSKHGYLKYLQDLLKALLNIGLKIPPKKLQLFRTELQCMANTILTRIKESVLNHSNI